MESSLRSKFNADFTSEKYAALLRCVNETEKWPADFRISETPIFLTREFTDEVTQAAYAIVDQTRTSEFARHTENAIPEGLEVPNESAHSNFLVVDFGICAEGDRLVPRLIELQAFPCLFGFLLLLLHCIRNTHRFRRHGTIAAYLARLRDENQKARPPIILRPRRPRSTDRADLQPRHLR